MKAFVTGATGFIGFNLTRALLEKGNEVLCLVRPGSNFARLQMAGAQLIEGDLLDPVNLQAPLLSCDTVIHVAGVTKSLTPEGYYRGNLLTTKNLLSILQGEQAKTQKLIYISSQAAAGPSSSPHFSEYDASFPISAYGTSKRDAEKAIFEAKTDGNFTILRPSIVFGPHDNEMLPLFKAAKKGIIPQPGFNDFPVNFIYVADLVAAILLAADHPEAAGKTYFIHDGRVSSWKNMNQIIKEEVNSRAIILPIARNLLQCVCYISGSIAKLRDKPSYMNMDKWLEIKQGAWLCSTKRFQQELGFTPHWSLEKAVSETASWYRQKKLL